MPFKSFIFSCSSFNCIRRSSLDLLASCEEVNCLFSFSFCRSLEFLLLFVISEISVGLLSCRLFFSKKTFASSTDEKFVPKGQGLFLALHLTTFPFLLIWYLEIKSPPFGHIISKISF